MSRRSSFKIAGQSFPIPERLKDKLFYEPDDTDNRLRELREAHPGLKIYKKDLVNSSPKRTQISLLVSKFARSKFDNNIAEQLRQNSEKHLVISPDYIVQNEVKNEKMALQSREEVAEQNLLNNLKKQKYG